MLGNGEGAVTVIVVFTSRRSTSHDAEYAEMADRMEELASQQPGFQRMVSVRDPGTREGITVSYFDDEESVRYWKENVEHREAQRRGIADFYEVYGVTVATVTREYGGAR